MVPANWKHPTERGGHYRPLHDGNFSERLAERRLSKQKWDEGLVTDWNGGWRAKKPTENYSYEEWDGKEPSPYDYMPEWKPEERTHFMMYETCSEGTPISPAFETAEALARWLADTGASSFGDFTSSYEEWLGAIQGKPSTVGMLVISVPGNG